MWKLYKTNHNINIIICVFVKCQCQSVKLAVVAMCAKLVLKHQTFESSEQALYDLHWLPIKARINQKILTFMYQCSIGSAPLYLIELLSRQVPKRQGLRSASSFDSDYDVPFNKRKTL